MMRRSGWRTAKKKYEKGGSRNSASNVFQLEEDCQGKQRRSASKCCWPSTILYNDNNTKPSTRVIRLKDNGDERGAAPEQTGR